jgi:hypothetical protein
MNNDLQSILNKIEIEKEKKLALSAQMTVRIYRAKEALKSVLK